MLLNWYLKIGKAPFKDGTPLFGIAMTTFPQNKENAFLNFDNSSLKSAKIILASVYPLFCLPPQTSNTQIEVVLFRTGLPSVSLTSYPISLIWETSDFDWNFRAILTVNKTVPWVCEESPIFPSSSDPGLDNQEDVKLNKIYLTIILLKMYKK